MEVAEPTPEALQRKLYFLLEQLQDMARELLPKYQMRVPIELLSGLANCLLNDTVFEIVKGLMEIQHVTEKHLFQQRLQIINNHACEFFEKYLVLRTIIDKNAIPYKPYTQRLKVLVQNKFMDTFNMKQHFNQRIILEIQEMVNTTQNPEQIEMKRNILLRRHKEELKQTDMKLVLQLDQKVNDQQDTLEKAGVPGFFVTNKPIEIKVQMYLLDFILRLSKMDIPHV